MAETFVVTAQWDEDAEVWVASSEDIPGLVTEAATLDALYERIVAVAPELLEDNAHLLPPGRRLGGRIDMHVITELSIGRTAAQ